MGISQRCPACNSARVRVAEVRSIGGYLRVLWGAFPARCDDCSARFDLRGGSLRSLLYAHCPHCLRQDLSTWDLKHYRATTWMRLKMLLGAHRWRCEVCRCNFVSLRPRKEHYVRPAGRVAATEGSEVRQTPA